MALYSLQIRDEPALMRWAMERGLLYVPGLDPSGYVVAAPNESDARGIAEKALGDSWWQMPDLTSCDPLAEQPTASILLTCYAPSA